MNPYVGITKHRFHPFFHNNSLLLQFILTEFFQASSEVRFISQLSESLEFGTYLCKTLEEDMDALIERLHNLAGCGEILYQLPWSMNRGILVKLKDYSDLLVHNANENEAFNHIHNYFHKVWLKCRQALDLLQSSNLVEGSLADTFKKIAVIIETINQSIRSAAKLIAQMIFEFRNDENVLFFLLRHHVQLQELYGREFLFKLFTKMYPKGMDAAEEFIVKKYRKRGFNDLIPVIKKGITELKLESL